MKNNPLTRTIIAIFFVTAFLCVSCSQNSGPAVDESPFRSAIGVYLKKNNYGMEISSFKDIKVEGDNASATCKMKAADTPHGLAVTWKFKFIKKDGKWEVKSHKA